jgi:selenocysteine-specific translation elongation factor
LSTVASTAAFDKSPQSKERGITLDLGFSAFRLPVPEGFTEGFVAIFGVYFAIFGVFWHFFD